MKESIAGISIIAFLCSLCFFTSNMTTDFCNDIQGYVDKCLSAIDEEDWKASEEIIGKARSEFEKSASLLKTFCVHKDINDIGNALSAFHNAIIAKSKEECLLQAGTLISCIDIFSETDLLNFENIL